MFLLWVMVHGVVSFDCCMNFVVLLLCVKWCSCLYVCCPWTCFLVNVACGSVYGSFVLFGLYSEVSCSVDDTFTFPVYVVLTLLSTDK